jgi:hypothetical protein
MGWLFQILPLLIVLFVVTSIIRAALKMAKSLEGRDKTRPESAANYDPAEAERTRRVREEIRRKIADRRAEGRAEEASAPFEIPPQIDPVYVEEPVQPAQPAQFETTEAVLERQEQLADQLHALEVARLMNQRKAAEVTALAETQGASAAAAVAMRAAILADLRTPSASRRAILLREILGTPVGLR